MKILNDPLPTYPQKAKEMNIQGRVEVQLLINEDGEVIFANPLSGPEQLWAECVKAAVTARFKPTTLSGKPVKITGRVIFDFKNGKVELPYKNGFRVIAFHKRLERTLPVSSLLVGEPLNAPGLSASMPWKPILFGDFCLTAPTTTE